MLYELWVDDYDDLPVKMSRHWFNSNTPQNMGKMRALLGRTKAQKDPWWFPSNDYVSPDESQPDFPPDDEDPAAIRAVLLNAVAATRIHIQFGVKAKRQGISEDKESEDENDDNDEDEDDRDEDEGGEDPGDGVRDEDDDEEDPRDHVKDEDEDDEDLRDYVMVEDKVEGKVDEDQDPEDDVKG